MGALAAAIPSLPAVPLVRLETVRHGYACVNLSATPTRAPPEQQAVLPTMACAAAARRSRFHVDAACAFLDRGVGLLRAARAVRGYVLLSLGTAGGGSPFHWRALQVIHSQRCLIPPSQWHT